MRKLPQEGVRSLNAADFPLWPYPLGKGHKLAISAANPSLSAARAIARAKAAAGLRTSRDLSATARLVGLELFARADKRTGMCAGVSIDSLAEAVGSCDRHVRRCIAQLVQHGFLLVIKRGGHLPDDYHLLVGKLAALGEAIGTHVQAVCSAAARAARAARAHVKARAGGILEAAREARRAAYEAAREARDRLRANSPPPAQKRAETAPLPIPDRTFCPRIPTMNTSIHKGCVLNFASKAGFWKAPGTPQGQALTDQQLDTKAQARVYEALRQLGQAALAQFLARPDAAQLEAAAIKAERYSQGSALAFLAAQLRHEVTA